LVLEWQQVQELDHLELEDLVLELVMAQALEMGLEHLEHLVLVQVQ
jgi:hypothetical protein